MKEEKSDETTIELPATNKVVTTVTDTVNNEVHTSVTKIALVVTFYFVVSISLVFLNKFIMKGYDFPYPIFVTWYQQVIALVCIWIGSKVGEYNPKLALIPPVEFNLEIAKSICPLTAVFVCMLSFNNLCLRYVEVWFYQVARSLTILFTICFTYFFLGAKTSRKAICACGVVVAGFLLGSIGKGGGDNKTNVEKTENEDGAFSIIKVLGIVFGLCSSMFVSLYGIYVKKKLSTVNNNEWRLLNYNTIISIFFLLPIIFIAQESSVLSEPLLKDFGFWLSMTITGIFGFLISIAIFMQVKFTSPLTNNISGTAKACCQTILAIFVWGSKMSFEGVLGTALVLGGSGWYSFIRYQEMMERKARERMNLSSAPENKV